MAEPRSFADLINLWPSAPALASDIGVKDVTARAWKARGIPAAYWNELVAAAKRREIQGVTLQVLADTAARCAGREPPE